MLTGLLDGTRKRHKGYQHSVATARAHLNVLETLTDAQLDERIADLRHGAHGGAAGGEPGLSQRIERVAVATEVIWRTLGLRLHDNQLAGALALHEHQVVELATGEGKTVMVVPFVFNALCMQQRVHITTANSYLAQRDAAWMAPAYRRLGVDVGHLPQSPARDEHTRQQLAKDVCYATVETLAGVWQGDQIGLRTRDQLFNFAHVCVVDEADAVLLDLVRAPVSLTRTVSADRHQALENLRLTKLLEQADESGDGDWGIDPAQGVAALLESGVEKLEAQLGVQLYDGTHNSTIAGITDALVAQGLLQRGRDYLVEDGRIRPVNPMTGRVSGGRFRSGLHSALEAKEKLEISDDVETLAEVAIGAFLDRYGHLCGMTATALSAHDELWDLYRLDTFALAPNRPVRRVDHDDVIVRTETDKFDRVAADAIERHRRGQPVLIGVDSIDAVEQVAGRLERAGARVRRLSAANHASEAEIIADAGAVGALTVATRMAGRGVDIVLGGREGDDSARQRVLDAGGLCVLGAQRFDSRRGDDQLRGRAGRQGDPGESRFYLSLEDELIRVYAREALAAVIDRIHTLNSANGDLSGHKQMTRLVDKAQAVKSGQQHALRKSLLAYDAVLAAQRDRVYHLRQQALEASSADHLTQVVQTLAPTDAGTVSPPTKAQVAKTTDSAKEPPGVEQARQELLSALDTAWREHLGDCRMLRDGIGLRRLAQRDPLVEYQRESHLLLERQLREVYTYATHSLR